MILRRHKPIYQIKNFREKFLWRLAELGLDQVDVAQRMGVIHRRVKAILHARRIEEATLARVSAALEWPIERWQRRLRVPKSPAKTALRHLMAHAEQQAKKLEQPKTFRLPRSGE